MSNPIEGGIQQVYVALRESLELILSAGVGAELYADAADACLSGRNPAALEQQVLRSLDDALSNNWDELLASFWRGVAADVVEMEAACRHEFISSAEFCDLCGKDIKEIL
jgi:hypothetical protein